MSNHTTIRIKNGCKAVCIGVGVIQLIYAILWAIQNGNNIQDFHDTALYLNGAVTMAGDGWRLLGYSAFVRVFIWLEQFVGEYYVIPLYLAQACITLLSFAYGCKTFFVLLYAREISYPKMLLPAIYILTIPTIWQMQFAILPDAICVAMLVLLFSKFAECIWDYKKMHWDSLLIAFGCLLLISVFHRHYFYATIFLGTLFGMVMLIRNMKKKYRNANSFRTVGLLIVCMSIALVLSGSVNSQYKKAEGYMDYSLAADLWTAFVYPNIREDYPHYSQQIQEALPRDIVAGYGDNYERYMNIIGPAIEERKPEQSESICFGMVKTGMALHTKEILSGFVKEGAAYALFPFAMEKCIYYNANSLYGHNLVRMYEMSPVLTLNYMYVGINGFLLVSIMGIIIFFVQMKSEENAGRNKVYVLLYSVLGLIGVTVPLMLFSIIKFDYRLGMFAAFLWGMLAVLNIFGGQNQTK